MGPQVDPTGIEPVASSLQMRRSTTELRAHQNLLRQRTYLPLPAGRRGQVGAHYHYVIGLNYAYYITVYFKSPPRLDRGNKSAKVIISP